MEICKRPFTSLEIDLDGHAFTCCPAFIKDTFIGNFFEQNFSELWNSETAKNIRQSVLDGTYEYCNRELCRQFDPASEEEISSLSVMPPYPEIVTLAYDRECNLACITCRDYKYKYTKKKLQKYNDKIDTDILPLLQNARLVCLDGTGEALYSRHSRLLIKRIAETYPDIKFLLMTNGLLCTEKIFDSLGVDNFVSRLQEIHVSLPAIHENIYEQIMIGSNLEFVKNNLRWLALLHDEGKLNYVSCHAVVSDINYRELPDICKFVNDLHLSVTLSPYIYWNTFFGMDFNEIAVWKPEHPHYEDFRQVLKSLDISDYKVIMPQMFSDIRNS